MKMQLETIYEKKKHWEYSKKQNKEKLLLQFLEENKWLQKIINKLDKQDKQDQDATALCPIDDEIDKLHKEIKQQHIENMQAIEQYPHLTRMREKAAEKKTNITLYPFVLSSLEAEQEMNHPPSRDNCSTPNSEEAEGTPARKKRSKKLLGYSPCSEAKVRPRTGKDYQSRYEAYMEARHMMNQITALEEAQVAEAVKGVQDARRHPADESQVVCLQPVRGANCLR